MRGAPQSRDVNILSRLELLCKDVGRPLLMTDTFAVEVAEPVIEIGHFELRGFRQRGSSPAVPNRPSRASDQSFSALWRFEQGQLRNVLAPHVRNSKPPAVSRAAGSAYSARIIP